MSDRKPPPRARPPVLSGRARLMSGSLAVVAANALTVRLGSHGPCWQSWPCRQSLARLGWTLSVSTVTASQSLDLDICWLPKQLQKNREDMQVGTETETCSTRGQA